MARKAALACGCVALVAGEARAAIDRTRGRAIEDDIFDAAHAPFLEHGYVAVSMKPHPRAKSARVFAGQLIEMILAAVAAPENPLSSRAN